MGFIYKTTMEWLWILKDERITNAWQPQKGCFLLEGDSFEKS